MLCITKCSRSLTYFCQTSYRAPRPRRVARTSAPRGYLFFRTADYRRVPKGLYRRQIHRNGGGKHALRGIPRVSIAGVWLAVQSDSGSYSFQFQGVRMFRKAVWVGSAAALVLAIASIANAQDPTFQAGSQKYKERNATGGKGRSGGATLAARLLLGKDGVTTLEATTAPDFLPPNTAYPATLPSFWKAQVAAIDTNGVTMFSYVYNNLNVGGYFTQSYNTFFPGEPFQIQGHVRTSTKKNDVVVVSASVQKRPD